MLQRKGGEGRWAEGRSPIDSRAGRSTRARRVQIAAWVVPVSVRAISAGDEAKDDGRRANSQRRPFPAVTACTQESQRERDEPEQRDPPARQVQIVEAPRQDDHLRPE